MVSLRFSGYRDNGLFEIPHRWLITIEDGKVLCHVWWDYPLDGLLWDCNFISFCNIFPRGAFFFYFNLQSVSLFLIPEFLHPLWRDHPMIIPHGVPFLSLSVLYLPEEKGF